ncbi:hypothetical protein ABXK36_38735, partial [Bacillus cereus]|uniref:hypothetical protein n=1 Tax=Bacillus cereus TaxID=1396 RepID=UPI0036006525
MKAIELLLPVSAAAAGTNPTSTAGSQIPSDGARDAISMKAGEPRTSAADSSYEAVLGIFKWLTDHLAQETSKRRLSRVAVQGVGGLIEFH